MAGVTLPLVFAGAVAVVGGGMLWRKRIRQARARFLAQFDFARLLDTRLASRRPELNPAQRKAVFHGLRDWFEINQRAGRRKLSMPSQAVDDAWHEFILFTRNYQDFCRKGLGRFLHHVPAEAMASPTQAQAGLKRSWRHACAHEGIDPASPIRLPRLFALDTTLGLADGFSYQLDCLKAGAAGNGAYCASHIGCGGGCSSCGSDSGSSDGGCGGGCGGD
ncbi:hypothetical protein [Denitromonas sp.]|uniref:glycine-rich domain-containing protein n=1 Tax=Denitromonas sp. TaxID=2734609 RepID=UPI002AFE6A31|nr:hypothetical protein [Denitromonas sp.]